MLRTDSFPWWGPRRKGLRPNERSSNCGTLLTDSCPSPCIISLICLFFSFFRGTVVVFRYTLNSGSCPSVHCTTKCFVLDFCYIDDSSLAVVAGTGRSVRHFPVSYFIAGSIDRYIIGLLLFFTSSCFPESVEVQRFPSIAPRSYPWGIRYRSHTHAF